LGTTPKSVRQYTTLSTPPGPRLSPRFDRLPAMTSATAAPGQPGPRLNAAFYADSVAAFLRASDDEVYAPLASPHGYTLAPEQLSAWRLQLPVLRTALAGQKGDSYHFRHADGSGGAKRENGDCHLFAPWIHLEFDIPRLGRRVDAVLVTSTAVIPIEFKVGGEEVQPARLRAGLGLWAGPQKLPRPEPCRGDLPDPLCHRGLEERPPLEAAPRRRCPPAVLLQCRRPRHRDRPGLG